MPAQRDGGDYGAQAGHRRRAARRPAAIVKLTEQIESATGVNVLSRLGAKEKPQVEAD